MDVGAPSTGLATSQKRDVMVTGCAVEWLLLNYLIEIIMATKKQKDNDGDEDGGKMPMKKKKC